MIEREDGKVTVTLGDGDVLMGATSAPGVVRLWFAPKPDDYPYPINKVVKGDTTPPDNVVATVFFLSRESLDQFVRMMTLEYLKAFPLPHVPENEGEGVP